MRRYRPKSDSPFKRFSLSPEIIRLVVMLYVRFPLSLRNVEDLLCERGINISYETVRFWWNRLAVARRRHSLPADQSHVGHTIRHWRRHLEEVFVKINGETHYLWRAVDHEGKSWKARQREVIDRRIGQLADGSATTDPVEQGSIKGRFQFWGGGRNK